MAECETSSGLWTRRAGNLTMLEKEISKLQAEAARIQAAIAEWESVHSPLSDGQRKLVIEAAEASWLRTVGTQQANIPGLCGWARQRN